MKNDLKIYSALEKQSAVFLETFSLDDAPVTEKIALNLGMDRTIVSRILNGMVKQDKIIKINTRPVIFVAVNLMMKKYLLSEYDSLDKFIENVKENQSDIKLKQIIGWNRSLKKQVQQIKAGLMYPNNGLPTIIFGKSGTGKSFFVHCAYEYAISAKIIDSDAPFVTINCAQYADNPELLSSILFGYVKGAFTGANTEKSGVLAKADGGVLFLDEVHRLSAEGQEKLFTYMDTGLFSPLGDDSKNVKSTARLVFATTENESNFLETFIRRVPIRINMPSLEQRSLYEKRQLIDNFFIKESYSINKKIEVSHKAINLLYKHVYNANVGEVKNLIKSIVATTYSDQATNEIIKISTNNLPEIFYKDIENSVSNGIITTSVSKTYDSMQQSSVVSGEENPLFIKIKKAWKYISEMDLQNIRDKFKYVFIVKNLMNHLYFSIVKQDDILFNHTITEIQNLLKIMHYGEDIYENSSFVYGLAVYIKYILNEGTQPIDLKVTNKLQFLFQKQYSFVNSIQPLFEKEFEIKLSSEDKLWIAMMACNEELMTINTSALIVAHGYATASSIADTANNILKFPIFHGVDMLPTATAEDIIEALKTTINRINPKNGLIIMIDMGSLEFISKKLISNLSYPVLLIDKVNTLSALEIGNYLQQEISFEEIVKKINGQSIECTLLNLTNNKTNIIISTCMTGIGTADKIQKLLMDSFENLIDVDVITCEFDKLQKGLIDEEKEKYNILGIIGIDDPHIENVPYLGLEDIISGSKMSGLEQMLLPVCATKDIKVVEQQLIKNFSLTRVIDSLTIISPEKVMSVLEIFITKIGKSSDISLSNKQQIALYVHLGSMIERIVRGSEIKKYKSSNDSIVHDSIFSVLKHNINVIENEFLIKVHEAEIAYIREIIVN